MFPDVQTPVVAGIFVGGASKRMGGIPKGLLVLPSGETLVERWEKLFRALSIPCVLVGRRSEYSRVQIDFLEDETMGCGPIGGLQSLLRHAGDGFALAVACDMPFVSRALVEHLLGAPREAPIVAPRLGARWETMFARCNARAVLSVVSRRIACNLFSLQGVFEEAGAERLEITSAQADELRDWDTPDDVEAPLVSCRLS